MLFIENDHQVQELFWLSDTKLKELYNSGLIHYGSWFLWVHEVLENLFAHGCILQWDINYQEREEEARNGNLPDGLIPLYSWWRLYRQNEIHHFGARTRGWRKGLN